MLGYGDEATWPADTLDPARDDEPEKFYFYCAHCDLTCLSDVCEDCGMKTVEINEEFYAELRARGRC